MLFKEADLGTLQSYITQLQAAKLASKGVFDATTVSTYADAIQGLEAKQAALLLSTQGLNTAQIQQTLTAKGLTIEEQYQAMVEAGLLARKQKLTVAQLQDNLQTILGSEADTKAAMTKMGLSMATAEEGNQIVKLTAKQIQAAVQSRKLTEAEAQELAVRTGVTLSMKAQTASTLPKWIATLKAATVAVWSQVKATAVWLATTPAGWATAAIAAIGGVALGLNKLAKSEKDASNKAQEAYEKSKERIQSNKEEAESLEKLIDKYKELKSASDLDSNTRSEIKELQYDIMELVGAEVHNLDLVNGALDEELAKLKEIAAEKARQNAEDAKDNYYQSRQTAEKLTGNYDDYGNDASISEAEIHKLLNIVYDTRKGSYVDAKGNVVQWAEILGTFTEQFGDIIRESENPFSRDIVVDTNEIASIEDRIKRLEELKEFIGDMGLRKSDFYTSVIDSITYYNDQYNNELEAVNALTDSLIDDLSINNKKLSEITVDSMEDFEQYRQTMISEIKSDETIGEAMADGILSDEAIEKAVNDFMATANEFSDWYVKWQESMTGSALNHEGVVSLSTALTSSEESLDKFQSSVKSAADAYTTLLTGNYSSSELLDSIQAITKAASDMGESIDWESISASGNPLQSIQDAIESVSKSYADSVLNDAGIDTDSKFGKMLANIVQEAYKSEAALDGLNTQIDSLQSAYDDLTDIVATYNETGYITFDQLQTLLAMEPQYLSCLIDENGQLQLNQESMMALANQRLDDAEAQVIQQAITELGELAYRKEQAAIEDVDAALVDSAETLTTYEEKLLETAQIANLTTSEFVKLSNAINGALNEGASQEQTDAVIDNMNKKLQLIGVTRNNLSKSFGGIVGKSSSSSSSKSEFSETVDYFERRVEVLDNALSHLDATMDNIAGSFGKNNLVDAELGINEEKFNNYTDALSMYTQKANEAFSKLPADIASKVKDGAVALTDFIGDGNKDVVEAIKDYESWADKIAECQQELAELQKEIRQLELKKFNNIMEDFESQFNLRGDSKDLISKQIDLLKEAGELIGESFFTAQIDQSKKQLELLESEKAQLVNQMSSAISSGKIQKGTDEFLEMVNALSDVDGSILDCKKSIEEFSNSILNLHTEIFNRIQDQFSDLDSEISNIIDLFDDFEVSDDKGIWSKEAIAQLGLLTQQYELAQYRVQQYNNEIDELNAQYLQGKYSATEYADKLAELNSEQWNAVKSTESAKDALMDLNETRIENQIKGIEKEIDAYRTLIKEAQNALDQEKALHDYQKSISDKSKNLEDIDRQISAVQNDTSASGIAQLKKLQAERQKIVEDLEEAEYEHSIETQQDALNAQLEAYEQERNEEIDALRESLNDRETILTESFNTVKENASTVGQEIASIATEHGITVSNTLISSWQSGEKAIASYGDVLSQNTSVFIGNIMGVENEVWNLQAQANTTADSLAWMFSTKADTLVNELNTSYFAEANLANMTNALQQSLVNTLERGYNISSITSALNEITNAAGSAMKALNDLNSMNGLQNIQGTQNTQSSGKWYITDFNGNAVESKGYDTSEEASKYLKEYNKKGGGYTLRQYASGTRNAEDKLRVVNEDGPELVLPKLSSGNYAIGNEGDQILTKDQTDNVYEWAKINPEDFTLLGQDELIESLRERSGNGRSLAEPMDFSALTKPSVHVMQEMFKNVGSTESVVDKSVNNATVNNHYDSMFKIEGDVIDADRITKQMEKAARKIANQEIDKSWREFSDELRYR